MMKRIVTLILLLMLLCPTVMAEGERAIDPQKPMLALTFDDGPTEHTLDILSMLAEFDCRATFFVIGNRVYGNETIVQATATAGHEIGNHTWNHPHLDQLTVNQINSALRFCNERVIDAIGTAPRLLRPPYGSISRNVYYEAKDYHLMTVLWSLDTNDWDVRDVEKIYQTIMKNVRDGDIILCHDTVPQSIEALRRAIPELQAQGYQFVTVSEMFSFAQEEMKYMHKYSHLYPDERKTSIVQN